MNAPPDLPADSLAARWWEATRERRLELQRCRGCGNVQHYPRPLCVRCHRQDLEIVAAGGGGTVYSFTEVHRSADPDADLPYVIALVRLDEGPVLLSRIVGAEPETLRCDAPVTVGFQPLPDGRALPVFTLRREPWTSR